MNRAVNIKTVEIDSIPRELLERRWPSRKWISPELEEHITSIIEEVKSQGDSALIRLTKKFDGADLSIEDLKVTREEIDKAYERVRKEWICALNSLKNRIEHLETQRLERMNFEAENLGVKVYFGTRSIPSVGCYVPGGEAAYPSTLVMTATPARLAGVRRVVVCSPPNRRGELNPMTLIAADLCEVDQVYKVGGAQAIAALAFGTGSIEPVGKIVGPGNRYVTAAKMLVSRDAATDAPAGPTEILILADSSADPRLIALDMVSQAEHGVDCISMLATTSREVAEEVVEGINKIVSSSYKKEIIAKALSDNGLIIMCGDLKEAIDFANRFAPEHIEIVTKEPIGDAEMIESAGLILIGPYTPVSASDYAFGTNHVLPTGGFGHVFSGLSVLDFIRTVSMVECSKEALSKVSSNVRALAEAEGLLNHGSAVEGRFEIGRKG